MKRLVTILLGGLLIAVPAYADETPGQQDNFDDYNDPGNQDNFNNDDNYENPDGEYNDEYENDQEFTDENNEEPQEEIYDYPEEEEVIEAPVIEEVPQTPAQSIVTEVKQDSYSITGTVFLEGKPVSATLEVDGKVVETKDGKYTVDGLQPGQHTITVTKADGKKLSKEVIFKIDDKDKVNMNIQLTNKDVGEKEEVKDEDKDNETEKSSSKTITFVVLGIIVLAVVGLLAFFLRRKK